jgi:Fe2+ transport system protein FeoA
VDAISMDCRHPGCRLVRALALGRPIPRRCRRECAAAAAVITLDQLGRGQTGRVIRVGGQPAVRRRLLELGVVRGEAVTLQRAAPLGDPLEFVVKGYHLSLRRREAAAITVDAAADAAAAHDDPAPVSDAETHEAAEAA